MLGDRFAPQARLILGLLTLRDRFVPQVRLILGIFQFSSQSSIPDFGSFGWSQSTPISEIMKVLPVAQASRRHWS